VTTHQLDPAPATTADVFSREHAPVLGIDPGDTVVVRSLDAAGYLARQTFPGEDQPQMYPAARGHCLTGPISVRGAQPGDMLALRLVSLRPDGWGWTVAAALDTPVTRRLGLADGPPSWLLWDLDPDAGKGTADGGFARGLAPFLGEMVCWMQSLFGLGKAAALALASTCVDLRITQVANQTWGVHAVLPSGILG
jgi:acetamidase/formamidase